MNTEVIDLIERAKSKFELDTFVYHDMPVPYFTVDVLEDGEIVAGIILNPTLKTSICLFDGHEDKFEMVQGFLDIDDRFNHHLHEINDLNDIKTFLRATKYHEILSKKKIKKACRLIEGQDIAFINSDYINVVIENENDEYGMTRKEEKSRRRWLEVECLRSQAMDYLNMTKVL